MTVMDLREANKPTLSLVNKITKDRIRAKRCIFIEQPLGSTWLKQPECADVLKYIDEGILLVLRVDGCQVGYKDAESGLPNKKPSLYITTLLAAESVFDGCLCDGSHQHEHLEGNNKYGSRTAQASVWPHTLNEMVLQAMVQQASAEATASHNTAEAFPSEVRPAEGPPGEHAAKRRKKKGRVAQLVGQYAAPPVDVRPDEPALYQTSIRLKKIKRPKPLNLHWTMPRSGPRKWQSWIQSSTSPRVREDEDGSHSLQRSGRSFEIYMFNLAIQQTPLCRGSYVAKELFQKLCKAPIFYDVMPVEIASDAGGQNLSDCPQSMSSTTTCRLTCSMPVMSLDLPSPSSTSLTMRRAIKWFPVLGNLLDLQLQRQS